MDYKENSKNSELNEITSEVSSKDSGGHRNISQTAFLKVHHKKHKDKSKHEKVEHTVPNNIQQLQLSNESLSATFKDTLHKEKHHKKMHKNKSDKHKKREKDIDDISKSSDTNFKHVDVILGDVTKHEKTFHFNQETTHTEKHKPFDEQVSKQPLIMQPVVEKVAVHEHILTCGPKLEKKTSKHKILHSPVKREYSDPIDRKKHKRKSIETIEQSAPKKQKKKELNQTWDSKSFEDSEHSKIVHKPLRSSQSVPLSVDHNVYSVKKEDLKSVLEQDRVLKHVEVDKKIKHGEVDKKIESVLEQDNKVLKHVEVDKKIKYGEVDKKIKSEYDDKLFHKSEKEDPIVLVTKKDKLELNTMRDSSIPVKKDIEIIPKKLQRTDSESYTKSIRVKELDLNTNLGLNDTILKCLDHPVKKRKESD